MIRSIPFRTRRALVAMVVLAALLAPERLRAQQPPIQVITTEVISVPTTVSDKKGRFIPGLKAQDFDLLEDNVRQEITSFAVEDSGVSAVLLLDASASMASRLDDVKRAATQFVRQLGPNDVASVIQFDTKVQILSGFTADRVLLEGAINRVTLGQETALHNALWTALRSLEARRDEDEAARRHRAIILLSDGDDTASAITADEVRVQARSVDALIYAVALGTKEMREEEESSSISLLRQLGEQTGGQVHFTDVRGLRKIYADISDELRHQYTVGYISSNTGPRGRWRAITVRLRRPNNDVRLRHRLGYYATGGGIR